MITPKQKRVHKTMRLTPEAVKLLADLAKQFDTSEGQIVEQMLLTYGPRMIK